MASKRTDHELLADIREAAERIITYCRRTNYAKFLRDAKTQDAVIRNFEVIGEATKNISKDLKHKYPHMAWRELAQVRDKLIHHYFGVNLDIVWAIIEESLPDIISVTNEILNKEKK